MKAKLRFFLYDKSGAIGKALGSQKGVELIPFNDYPRLQDAVRAFSIDAVVSPGNSYGLLGGGFDKAIADFYVDTGAFNTPQDVTKALQAVLRDEVHGYNPVANVVIAPFEPKLIHVPTMAVPSVIPKGSPVVFNCVWNILASIERHNRSGHSSYVNNVLITGLGTGTGGVSAASCARQMKLALDLFASAEPIDHIKMNALIKEAALP